MSLGGVVSEAVCSGDWSIFAIKPNIDASLLQEALKNPTAIRFAYDGGLLEILGVSVTALAAALAIFGLIAIVGYGRIVDKAAREEARRSAPTLIAEYLDKNPEAWVTVIRENPGVFSSAFREVLADANGILDNGLSRKSAEEIAKEMGDDDESTSTDQTVSNDPKGSGR